MKKKDERRLGQYIRDLADEMGLRDWTITVRVGDPDTGHDKHDAEYVMATMFCVHGRKVGVLTIDPSCRMWDLDELRYVVAHELTHIHLDRMWSDITQLISELGAQARTQMQIAAEDHFEHTVDGIAGEWARNFPLIEWS